MKKKENFIMITGEIVVCDWDKKGHPCTVYLDTDDEIYTLHRNPVHQQLLACIGKQVQVSGTMGTGSFGEKRLTPSSFRQAETAAAGDGAKAEHGVQ